MVVRQVKSNTCTLFVPVICKQSQTIEMVKCQPIGYYEQGGLN